MQGTPTANADYLICDTTNTPPSGVNDTDLGATPGANDWLIINGASWQRFANDVTSDMITAMLALIGTGPGGLTLKS